MCLTLRHSNPPSNRCPKPQVTVGQKATTAGVWNRWSEMCCAFWRPQAPPKPEKGVCSAFSADTVPEKPSNSGRLGTNSHVTTHACLRPAIFLVRYHFLQLGHPLLMLASKHSWTDAPNEVSSKSAFDVRIRKAQFQREGSSEPTNRATLGNLRYTDTSYDHNYAPAHSACNSAAANMHPFWMIPRVL